MATGSPIVSTAIEDVILQFSDVVQSAVHSPDEKSIRLGLELAKLNSWNAIVERLEQHIADVLAPEESTEAETVAA